MQAVKMIRQSHHRLRPLVSRKSSAAPLLMSRREPRETNQCEAMQLEIGETK
jgi:hypothetical protein